jgi:hypothetical protein
MHFKLYGVLIALSHRCPEVAKVLNVGVSSGPAG